MFLSFFSRLITADSGILKHPLIFNFFIGMHSGPKVGKDPLKDQNNHFSKPSFIKEKPIFFIQSKRAN